MSHKRPRFAMPRMSVPSDITFNKHKGAALSVAANPREGDKVRMRAKVYNFIKACGPVGATCHEVAYYLDTLPNVISGRFTELKLGRWITQIGQRPTQTGNLAAVYRANER